MTAAWGPRIGEGFCRQYYPVWLFFVRSAIALPVALLLMAIAIPALAGSSVNSLLIVALLVVAPALIALFVSVHRVDIFGRRVAAELDQAGYPSDGLVPLRTTNQFDRWRATHNIPTEAIIGIGNRRYGQGGN
ncbi:hypothetical protein [Cryobacterium mannosilyticum]|uniref:Uncharacterized protein n=1 Tax=Cryobacterium mannosilyticum TaxID=1259190 RepID=A0A4V3IDR1_9MICO|nr:hypothetical protein [Cryobacterium mannosilyticum]TFC08209.1 hypothetical protein E3O32_00040 [Cryobacterium mannosilyticum]